MAAVDDDETVKMEIGSSLPMSNDTIQSSNNNNNIVSTFVSSNGISGGSVGDMNRKRPLEGGCGVGGSGSEYEGGGGKGGNGGGEGSDGEEEEGEGGRQDKVKRSHFSPAGGDGTFHFKMLVPSATAGAIIGKGGETIAQLQKETGSRVKMSKSHDFYPGTTERVCLVTGGVDAIAAVLDFVMDKVREKPASSGTEQQKIASSPSGFELSGDAANSSKMHERERQVKILVPNSTAGMIIGKAGNHIKQMKERSGSYVQISQKSKDVSLQERCITVIGDREQNKLACRMILAKIVEDPQSGSCPNVSYADVSGPVANYNPTGSPFANQQTGNLGINSVFGASNASLNAATALGTAVSQTLMLNGAAQAHVAASTAPTAALGALAGLQLTLNLSGGAQTQAQSLTGQLLDHVKIQLRSSGFADSQIVEICAAIAVLAKYGVIAIGLGHPHHYAGHHMLDGGGAGGGGGGGGAAAFGAIGHQVNLAECLGANSPTPRPPDPSPFEAAPPPSLYPHHRATAATHQNAHAQNGFGLAALAAQQMALAAALNGGGSGGGAGGSKSPTPDVGGVAAGGKDRKDVEIAEVIVGAILGPGGRSLVEIQHLSGAQIQISKKGVFAPGTRNRIVTISGPQHAIHTAQYLIEQRIGEEEAKRARGGGGGV